MPRGIAYGLVAAASPPIDVLSPVHEARMRIDPCMATPRRYPACHDLRRRSCPRYRPPDHIRHDGESVVLRRGDTRDFADPSERVHANFKSTGRGRRLLPFIGDGFPRSGETSGCRVFAVVYLMGGACRRARGAVFDALDPFPWAESGFCFRSGRSASGKVVIPDGEISQDDKKGDEHAKSRLDAIPFFRHPHAEPFSADRHEPGLPE